ncbi:ABC transporter substrate-binding protein [Fodinicola feengrottensis]|uniref:ABC transporter substrate-binding protein n=1 Tax=Fodinicola feengrottensis TaxID=435914 RepID=A0ABP4UTK9_9ACTN
MASLPEVLVSIGGARDRSVLALVVAATLAVTAACGGGAGRDGAPAPKGKPVAGRTLTVAVPSAPNSLNPATVDNAFVSYTMLAYDPLIYQASDGSLKPALAASWKYVGTGNKDFTLALRPGVTFSDGGALTAAGVKASLDYARKAVGAQAQLLGAVQSVDVTGPLSLSIKLAAPVPLMPQILTQFYGVGEIISPKGLADPAKLTVSTPSAGIGAYVFDPSTSVAGDHYTYVARRGYYDPSRQHYQKIVMRVIANPQAALNALKTKQVDVITGADVATAAQAKAAGMQVASVPFVWQGLNLIDRGGQVSKPLGDVRVRQAINYAIDRATVSRAVLGQYGVPTVQTVVPGADGYSPAAAKRYPYDLAKAKQLLAAAGYRNGFTLAVLVLQFPGMDTMGQAIAGQLAKVGITLKLTTVTDAQSYVTDSTNHRYPTVLVGYGAGPMYLMGQGLFLPAAAVFNGFKTSSAPLIALYGQAAAAEPAARAGLDQQMQEYLVENAWFAPVAFTPVLYFGRADLGGLTVSPAVPVASPLDWFDTK